MAWEIIKWEDGRYFEFVHVEGKLKGSIASYHVEPDHDGCRVSIHANMTGPFIMRIVMLFMKDKLRKGTKADLEKLKNLMETQ